MNNDILAAIFNRLSNNVEGQSGHWKFKIEETLIICLSDQIHNRMRIISPIIKVSNISPEQITKCMEANFHSVLDIRYSISDDILWAAFIHPLKELTEYQVEDAIKQVYSGANTFGTYYSSGTLIFPTREDRNAKDN